MRLVCGVQPVREAIRARGPDLEKVLVAKGESADGPQLDALARFATDHGVKVERTTRAELDRLTKGATHQGALAWAPELRVVPLDALDFGPRSLFIALDELQDPQNFGAIVRSAVALGAAAVIWPEHRSAPLSAAMFRASAGAVEHATLCRVSALPNSLATLRAEGVTVVGLDMNGDHLISDVDLTGPVALVVGAEGKGLRKTVKSACDVLARLPMRGNLASLNASVAAAIALYEVARQRNSAGEPKEAPADDDSEEAPPSPRRSDDDEDEAPPSSDPGPVES
jgi:23S rRNA (guanosine2251-2'-O)-methyltransferase